MWNLLGLSESTGVGTKCAVCGVKLTGKNDRRGGPSGSMEREIAHGDRYDSGEKDRYGL